MKLRVLLCVLLLGLLACSGAAAGADDIELSGHVQDAQGSPLAGVSVLIYDMDDKVAFDTTPTDADGNFSITIPAGRYAVSAELTMRRANATYENITSSTDSLDFTLYGLGTVAGYVTDGNTTLPGVKITLRNSMEEHIAYTTSPWGRFVIDNVTAGEYIATAEKLGYNKSTYLDPVRVVIGTTFELNFTLSEIADKSAQLGGRVTAGGKALPGVRVVLVSLDGAELVAYTDAQGSYQFKGIAPGQYQLIMSKGGYVGSSQKVALQLLDQRTLDVMLNKDSLPGNSGFILDYDLAHSLMVVALGLSLLTTVAALLVRSRGKKRPEILEKEADEE